MKSLTPREEEFQEAVEKYRGQITSEYRINDRDGGRQDSEDLKDRVIELYRSSPQESRMSFLYITLKTMSTSVVPHYDPCWGNNGAEQQTTWLREVGQRLAATLEDIP